MSGFKTLAAFYSDVRMAETLPFLSKRIQNDFTFSLISCATFNLTVVRDQSIQIIIT